jgi:hypothetical protein
MIFLSERTKAGAMESMMHHGTGMAPGNRNPLTVADSGSVDVGMRSAEPGGSLNVVALQALRPSRIW